MNKTQNNKLSMHYATQKACERQIDVVNEFLPFKEAFQDFCECLIEIEGCFRRQDMPTTGITQDKASLKSDMTTAAMDIASGISFYAVNTKNKALLKKATLTSRDISYVRDFTSIQRCVFLKSLAEEHLPHLAAYGILPTHVESLANHITAFQTIRICPRELRDQRKATTQELKLLFKKADYILKEKMDRMVRRLRSSHPQFYQEYFIARMICDTGIRRSKPEESPETTA